MIAGVDIGKCRLGISIYDNNKILEKKIIEFNKEELEKIIKKYKIKEVVCEYTGIYTIKLLKILKKIDKEIKLYYFDPGFIVSLRKKIIGNKKDDKTDSYFLSKIFYAFKEEAYELNNFDFELYELVRQHKIIKKHLSKIKTILSSDEEIFNYKHLKESALFLENKKKEIEKEIKKRLSPLYKKIIEQVEGLNYISLAYILAETKDIRRFKEVWKFLAYSGVVPITYSSGNKESRIISSKVNKTLKGIFYNCALGSLRIKNGKMKKIYDKKRKEGKHHFVAIFHVAKRIARKTYELLNNSGQAFSPARPTRSWKVEKKQKERQTAKKSKI